MPSESNPERAQGLGRGLDSPRDPRSAAPSVNHTRHRPRRYAFGQHCAPVSRPRIDPTSPPNGQAYLNVERAVSSPIVTPATQHRTALIAAQGSANQRRQRAATGAPNFPWPSLSGAPSLATHGRPSVAQFQPTRDIQLPYAYAPIPDDIESFPPFVDTSSLGPDPNARHNSSVEGVNSRNRSASVSAAPNLSSTSQSRRESPSPPRSS